MNFDFLEGLYGLGDVYENCINAEALVKTEPVKSVFESRKSAEIMARFIYLAAHNAQMKKMSFEEILGDLVVCDFINDRKVMDAFDFIRNGGDDEEKAEEAIDVLRNLHHIAGEIACKLDFFNDYPDFENEIEVDTDVKTADYEQIEVKAERMFLEYDKRGFYYENNIDDMKYEFSSMCSGFMLSPGYVDVNEVLEIKDKLKNPRNIKPIQAYYGFLGMRALRKLRGELPKEIEDRKLEFSGELTIYGENGYTTSDLAEFIYGILYDLPSADGFKVVTTYYGPSIDPWFGVNEYERKAEFHIEVEEIAKSEELSYAIYEFLYNHGGGWTGKLENGKWVDLTEQYTDDILDKDFGSNWWSWNIDLMVDFDFEKYPEIVEELHNRVRKHIPEDEIRYCEDAWEDGDVGSLCCSVDWSPRKLREVQNFLDDLNQILKPIIKECNCDCNDSKWYIKEAPFAVATWEWTEEGFKVIGTQID